MTAPSINSRFSQNAAVVGLVVVLVAVVIGSIVLALDGSDLPDLLKIVGGGTVGSLGTLATGKSGT